MLSSAHLKERKKMKNFICVLGVVFVLCSCLQKDLKKVIIKTENKDVTYFVEVASTKEKMIKGLMFRKKLKKNSGMLFLFDEKQ